MEEPGAKMSRHVPKLEYEARASVVVVAPAVNALVARAGEKLQAFALLLPAATAETIPAATMLFVALSIGVSALPPRLMLLTAGWTALLMTQLMPLITDVEVPEPEQSSTRTA
jgi:hypothetical protein